MIVMRMASGVRSHFVTRMPEWGLSTILLAFGAQLLWHEDSFDTSVAYRLLARFVSEGAWGGYAVTIAAVWLGSLAVNGMLPLTRRWTPWIRSVCGFAASAFWAVNAFAYVFTAPAHPGTINNAGYAFLALTSSIIIAREVGVSDGKAKKCQSRRKA